MAPQAQPVLAEPHCLNWKPKLREGQQMCWWSSGTSSKMTAQLQEKEKEKKRACLSVVGACLEKFLIFQHSNGQFASCLCVIVVILPALCCSLSTVLPILCSILVKYGKNIVRSYWNSREVSLDSCVFGCVCARVCLCSAVVVV